MKLKEIKKIMRLSLIKTLSFFNLYSYLVCFFLSFLFLCPSSIFASQSILITLENSGNTYELKTIECDKGGICGISDAIKIAGGDGNSCSNSGDCLSGVCEGGTCQAPACSDGVKNGNETDIDCGGSCGATCETGKSCSSNGDCVSGNCDTGFCAAPLWPFSRMESVIAPVINSLGTSPAPYDDSVIEAALTTAINNDGWNAIPPGFSAFSCTLPYWLERDYSVGCSSNNSSNFPYVSSAVRVNLGRKTVAGGCDNSPAYVRNNLDKEWCIFSIAPYGTWPAQS